MYMHIIRLAIMLFKKFYYIFDIGSLRTSFGKSTGIQIIYITQNNITFKIFRINIVYIQIDVLCDLLLSDDILIF